MQTFKTLVIQTQYKENYGFFDGDDSNPHWKFKGGTTYFVTDLNATNVARIEERGIPHLADLIEYNNGGSQEYIIDYEIRELGKGGDGKGPICEHWETPVQFRWDGSKWLAQTNHTYGEDEYVAEPITGKAQQWVPLSNGERQEGSFSCQYKTSSGWLDSDLSLIHISEPTRPY